MKQHLKLDTSKVVSEAVPNVQMNPNFIVKQCENVL